MRVALHFVRWSLGLAAAETQTSEAERACLARHASGRRRLVEIGVWHGVTTRLLRSVMDPEGVLYAVDPFPRGRLGVSIQRIIARSEVGRFGGGRVVWLRRTGSEAAAWFAARAEAPVDFVFVDGDHSWESIQSDWEGWRGLVAEGGIVALHDSRAAPGRPIEHSGSTRYTNEVILHDGRFEVVETVETLTVLRRRGVV